MKALIPIVGLMFMLGCAPKPAETEQVPAETAALHMDANSPYAYLETILELTGGQAGQVYGYERDIWFEGTAQEVQVNYDDSGNITPAEVIVTESVLSYPDSENASAPLRWKTKAGLYVGMSMDSVQLINGRRFTLAYKPYELTASWDGGLVPNYMEVQFSAVDGSEVREAFSDQLIREGKKLVISQIRMTATNYLAEKNKGATTASGTNLPGDYAHFSTQLITPGDLEGMTADEVRIARNEIFARYGYMFKSEDLQEHFAKTDWYKAEFVNVDNKLTPIEKQNIALMVSTEKNLKEGNSIISMVRRLRFLKLPLRYELEPGSGIEIPHEKNSPDGSEYSDTFNNFKRELYGLLPDTTGVYAVVWKAPANMTVAGVMGATAVTTINKYTGEPIMTAFIRVHLKIDEYGSDCSLSDSFDSVINADWSYYSEYNARVQCPDGDGNAEEPTTHRKTVSGRIFKNGEISEESVNENE